MELFHHKFNHKTPARLCVLPILGVSTAGFLTLIHSCKQTGSTHTPTLMKWLKMVRYSFNSIKMRFRVAEFQVAFHEDSILKQLIQLLHFFILELLRYSNRLVFYSLNLLSPCKIPSCFMQLTLLSLSPQCINVISIHHCCMQVPGQTCLFIVDIYQ